MKFLIEQKILNHDQQKWIVKMLGYDFKIVDRLGCENKVADILLRKPDFFKEIQAYSVTQMVGREGIQEKIEGSEKL